MNKVEQLINYQDKDDRFRIPKEELLPLQIEAADEIFKNRVDRIPLLAHRAEEGSITSVRELADIVPLLFAHTAYKSYPENWLIEHKWDRMAKWLNTVTTYPVEGIDTSDIESIDDWVARLEAAGHYVYCSSGTTGKAAMLTSTAADLEWSGRNNVLSIAWATGEEPRQERRMFSLAMMANVSRNNVIREAIRDAYGDPAKEHFVLPVPAITMGSIAEMVSLRRKMADGSATPDETTAYERISQERQEAIDNAIGIAAETLIEARHEKLFLTGMWAQIHKIAEAVRERGYDAKDFHPENILYQAGGLKGAQLPDDYQEYIFQTFNLSGRRIYQMYSMQEINTALPRCEAGRYHVPPWVILLLLDESGDNLISAGGGEMEGRAAFFDLSLDGRWPGVISGDKISVDYGKCVCGNEGPSIRDNIVRYADLVGDDKISCAGTIDAYVRGVV